ncbi:MAG: phosphatase [Candidatus Delongbacteria bacterium]|jgi:exopolyphosphatase/guanosine-5'-triphosphate,3'-diphosphate pyrophosphatase|nr:phosphatase [Candidatus Delongbacteria bacterium]
MMYAGIDIGTNTCNLSVAGWEAHRLNVVRSEKSPIKLGAEGFPDGNVPEEAQKRLVEVLISYKAIIEQYPVTKYIVLATSAIRNANNKAAILQYIKNQTGFDVVVITGDDEAKYIYQGVREAVPLDEKPCLLLDIGGGSNEIQIASMGKVYWRVSVDYGIARLLNWFEPSDPLKPEEIEQIVDFLYQKLGFLKDVAKEYEVNTLVGSSGSFDTFASMYIQNAGLQGIYKNTRWFGIPLESYLKIHHKLITHNQDERLAMPGMEAMRVEMIPLASVFTKFLIDLFSVNQLIRSAYALKEGIIVSMARSL